MQLRTYFFALLILIVAISARAEAQGRVQNYQDYMVDFLAWSGKSAADAQILTIFPGFKPPTVKFMQYGLEETRVEEYKVYVTKMQVVVNKPTANLQLGNLVRLDTIQKMTRELEHRAIGSSQTLPALAGKAPIANFNWCNANAKARAKTPDDAKADHFTLAQKEKQLSYLINPARPWCPADNRTICLESCYYFSEDWKSGVDWYNSTLGSGDPKDKGQAMQSEIRYFVSEEEYGARTRLSQVTGVGTTVRGVMEQNTFYFNQVFTWAKVVAVFQEHPTDTNKTIMTVQSAFALRSKYCTDKKYFALCKAIKGEPVDFRLFKVKLNTQTGISAGIPIYSREVATGLAQLFEQN